MAANATVFLCSHGWSGGIVLSCLHFWRRREGGLPFLSRLSRGCMHVEGCISRAAYDGRGGYRAGAGRDGARSYSHVHPTMFFGGGGVQCTRGMDRSPTGKDLDNRAFVTIGACVALYSPGVLCLRSVSCLFLGSLHRCVRKLPATQVIHGRHLALEREWD